MRGRIALLAFAAVSLFTLPASAEIYRWVDQQGKVHFSDQAPAEKPEQAQKVTVAPSFEGKSAEAAGPSSPAASASTTGSAPTKAAARSFPKVEVYTTSWCPWCKKAVGYLQANGVPYTEYDVEKDQAAAARFKTLNPRGGVPFTVIGSEKIPGFDAQGYARALGLQGR